MSGPAQSGWRHCSRIPVTACVLASTRRYAPPPRTQKGAILVPQRAVIDLQGTYHIAVVDHENKVKIQPVKLGETVGPIGLLRRSQAR